jgi:hypothetical protein
MSQLAQRQEELKLDIVASLARSQRALVRILESVADTIQESPPSSEELLKLLKVIAEHQIVLSSKLVGIRLRRLRRGKPGKPWMHTSLVRPKKKIRK